jgi:esterase/lipase
MKKWLKVALIAVVVVLVVAVVVIFFMMRPEGVGLVRHPMEEREPLDVTLADYGVSYEDVTVTTEDGLRLVGWYVPSQKGAAIIAQHGYKGDRGDLVVTADLLQRHGYGVLLTTMRAHDQSEGDLITLGKEEMKDFEAWYQYLLTRDDVDPDRIGILGESMGGALSIKYAAQNPNIKAVVAHSAFADFDDTVEKAVTLMTGLPPFPFAPMIIFWAEREADIETSEIDATEWIKGISPRPVFILQGGADDHISIDSGQRLYEAAGEPKELWYEEKAVHHGLEEEPFVAEFERRVVGFFDQHLGAE